MISTMRLASVTAVTLSLAACGGGSSDSTTTRSFTSTPSPSNITSGGTTTVTSGGTTTVSSGGSTSTPVVEKPNFTGFSNVSDDGDTTLEGQTVGTNISVNGITNSVRVGGIFTTNGKGKFTRKNGELTAISVDSTLVDVDFDKANGDTIDDEGILITARDTDNQSFASFDNPDHPDVGYEYQTFGSWITDYGKANAKAGAGSFGARTDAADIPQNQSATYIGAGSGFARLSDGEAYLTSSAVRVDTDFSTVNIASVNTQAINVNTAALTSAPELDFQGSGQVTGERFSADISGTGTSGRASGHFYGPNAEEVGGTFSTSGSRGVQHIGAFGAN